MEQGTVDTREAALLRRLQPLLHLGSTSLTVGGNLVFLSNYH